MILLLLIGVTKSELPGFYAKVVRPPHYHYSYEVQDEGAGVNYGQSEVREGAKTQGTFHVNLPYGHYQYLTYQINHDETPIAPAHGPPIPLYEPPEALYEVPEAKPEFVAPELPPAYRAPPSYAPSYTLPEMAPAYHPPAPNHEVYEEIIGFPPIPTYETPKAPETAPPPYYGVPFAPDFSNSIDYGAPLAPVYATPLAPEYGALAVTEYSPPVTPTPTYSPPTQNHGVRIVNHGARSTTPAPPPVTSYGAPAENYSEPAPDYGPPVVPTTDYQGLRGAPESYGTPTTPIPPTTPAPALEPYENYGPPYENYGPPYDFYGKNEMTFDNFAPVTKKPAQLYITPHPQVEKQVHPKKPMTFPEEPPQKWTPINPYATPPPPRPYSPTTPLYRHHFQKQNYVENPPYFASSPMKKRRKVYLRKEYDHLRGRLSGFLGNLGALAVLTKQKINRLL